jgi:hypothetical protein
VTDERLLKINPENLERQREVEKEVQASKGQTPPSNYTRFLSVMSSVSDPEPGGQKLPTEVEKIKMDVLLLGLKASSVALKFFVEA